MVHRQADSRLLTNLIQQEKEYSKQVNQLLDSSCAAVGALAAYAASSPPPVSHVIMELTGTLGAADAALKRYALGVDEWRETMRTLKDAEEEVGNIMRDREILVTRLIKASKSSKGGARESLLLTPQSFPSSSSLSLSTSGQHDSPSPPPSRPLSTSFSTSSKLAAAQTELQACEAHLASKERELEQKRSAAIREGLGVRMKAMMDCGWVWNELGKEALRTLEQLRKPSDVSSPIEAVSSTDSRVHEGLRPFSDFSSIGPSQSVSQVNSMHNAPPPVSMAAVLNSAAFGDIMQSDQHRDEGDAREHEEGEKDMAQPSSNDQQEPSGSSNTGSSLSKLATPTTYKIETVTYAPAVPVFIGGKEAPPPVKTKAESIKSDYSSIHVPPPHAIDGYTYGYPTAAPSTSKEENLSPRSTPTISPVPTPQRRSSFTSPPIISAFHTHKLERRITEEDVRRRSVGGTSQKSDEASEEEDKLVQEGKLEVVENPRFMSEARKREIDAEKERARRAEEARVAREQEPAARATGKQKVADVDDEVIRTPGKEKKRFSLFHSSKDTAAKSRGSTSRPPLQRANDSDAHISVSDAGKSTNTSPSKGFFGGIKGLFTGRPSPQQPQPAAPSRLQESPVMVERNDMSDSDDDDESPKRTPSKRRGLFSSRGSEEKRGKGWATRTDKNLREITRSASYDADLERRPSGIGAITVASVGLGTPSTSAAGVAQRNRVSSEVGTTSAPAPSGSVSGRKLKKRGPASPAAVAVENEHYFENRPAAAPASLPRAASLPRRTPTEPAVSRAPVPAPAAPEWHRRSSSVDVTMANRKSWTEDENGAMIVDLGRRRTASEVDAPSAAAARATAVAAEKKPLKPAIRTTQQQQQQSHPVQPISRPPPQQYQQPLPPSTVSIPARPAPMAVGARDYASDTGAAPVVRKKSLTKKKQQAPESTVSTSILPPPVATSPVLTSLGPAVSNPPVRSRASVKSTATATSTAAAKKPTTSTIAGATVMPAGGHHPSGTLTAEPGWQTQGGGLSRNTSIASAGSAAAAARKKPTVLGQGMQTSAETRRATSLGAPTTAANAAAATAHHAHHTRATSAGGSVAPVIQPLGPAASLMSIVEDVARVNRDGWNRDAKVQKSVGGSQVPTAMMDVVPKAPPAMNRKFYEAMSDKPGPTTAAPIVTVPQAPPPASTSVVGQVPSAPPPAVVSRTGMFEVTAPKSIFEQRENLYAHPSPAAPSSAASAPARPPASQSQVHQGPIGAGKVPLRSALRTSRSPSPVISTSRGSAQASPAMKPVPPPPVDVHQLPWAGDNSSTPRLTREEKGKAPVRGGPPPQADVESGDDDDESNYETGDEMLDVETGQVGPDGRPVMVRRSSSGRRRQAAASAAASANAANASEAAAPPPVNGHAVGYDKGTQSTASTVVGQQPQSVVSSALTSSDQGPRRRKSVRVSLQPTFSPSPPAIEYDDEEEQKMHAPWAFNPTQRRIETERQPMSLPPPPPLPAPKPVHAQAQAPQYTQKADAGVVDMWADSDEEDEEYLKAKRMLSRAAKKEKDVTLMVANRNRV